MITAEQIRSARYALKLSVVELSESSAVSTATIKRIEASKGIPKSTKANLEALKKSLEKAGIEFVGTPEDGPGIRIHSKPKT